MKNKTYIIFIFLFCPLFAFGQKDNALEKQIADSLTVIANYYSNIGKVTGITIKEDSKNKRLTIAAPVKLSYIPFREENVNRINHAIRKITSSKYKNYNIQCTTDGLPIEDLIPNYFRTGNQPQDKSRKFKVSNNNFFPLIKNISKPCEVTNGLQGKYLAIWHSHGLYYNQQSARWEWQRARLNQTVEDIYTLSYTLPFLVPMLENAGATVFLPRERDFQSDEIIVDNDDKHSTSKYKDRRHWQQSAQGEGFAHLKNEYLFGENPFSAGTYMYAQTIENNDDAATAEWLPHFEKAGRYAVYIAYKTLKNSAADVHYTVFHAGGRTEFVINQTMGGGTWIYLGTFDFELSKNNDNQRVVLSSFSTQKGKTVTADAVRFGGGLGNIARKPTADTLNVFYPIISEKPRWTEGARYYLQWAGVPDSVYSRTHNENDYTDDFTSRGAWVNYLAGGSQVLPQKEGLNIPIDIALALHSDAGTTINDSIIGTLGIFSIPNTQKVNYYDNGISRWAARDLADIIQNQIVKDVRQQIAPEWTCRNLWDKSYSESREPQAPSLLLELLSHQNFADMRYGLDPRFQFVASRAIYKGILRYLSNIYGEKYVVQPLPVTSVSCEFISDNALKLRWQPTLDSIEPTATPEKFIVYQKIDSGGFDNGILVDTNFFVINNLAKDKIYSFKITAVNSGGESFPGEIVSACRITQSKGTVMIVNAFDRICAPASFDLNSNYAGFLSEQDAGVPYLYSLNYTGQQFDFDRRSEYIDNDSPGFGASFANCEGLIIAGNTFDYPFIHGKAIAKAGFSFVSCSKNAVLNGDVSLSDYKIVDIILGKQKKTLIGNGRSNMMFETFSSDFQNIIKNYLQNEGNLLVSGAYIGADLAKNGSPADKNFLENVLKCKFIRSQASVSGKANVVQSPVKQFVTNTMEFYNAPNAECYFVESPDALAPANSQGYTIARYADGNMSAAVANQQTNSKICVFAFPLETIKSETSRNTIFEQILDFFE
ncbi:MAG: xanthan lyase [Paludibacter sp.]|nr:xanthan lyase [Paludibacter sp.]